MHSVEPAETIHVVNAADDAYIPHVGAMLHSMFTHAENHGEIHFHFLHDPSVNLHEVSRLERLCRGFGAGFSAITVDADELNGFPISKRFPVQAWYRVVLPDLLPQLDRVLWLDADTLVLDDVKLLWQISLQGAPLAACPNPVLFGFKELIRELDLPSRDRYFNSGVMLMDLALMRRERYRQAFLTIGTKYFDYIRFADQDVLNVAYFDRYRRLPLDWNVLTHSFLNVPETKRIFGEAEYKRATKHPKVLHFTGTGRYKPWSYVCGHPFQTDYLWHREQAGWPLNELTFTTKLGRITRRLPLRLRFIVKALRSLNMKEALSFIRQW